VKDKTAYRVLLLKNVTGVEQWRN